MTLVHKDMRVVANDIVLLFRAAIGPFLGGALMDKVCTMFFLLANANFVEQTC